eukprot:CAMPEP_0185584906 /NCGR_PEP_ID=MMETSP0434-20130131/35340_1 /TAXON_ID=626734 ORGANISM="Favella taraikaensis, Strain Fe Narragansett Bay" /NCGR_SAMPLE_ID=MMETSP0434 /ASSEMBLY_ACC=CAM_ASM_000379 /LENGTH=71 /DNA_ID=CAMNT_0028204945 /DNA_START=1 /DNA_END=214 /DNA_ORIENTATION=+
MSSRIAALTGERRPESMRSLYLLMGGLHKALTYFDAIDGALAKGLGAYALRYFYLEAVLVDDAKGEAPLVF